MIPAKPEAFRLMMEGSLALADVEANGMRIDVDYLRKAIDWTGEKISELEEEMRQDEVYSTWRKVYGSDSDLSKPVQLASIVFDHLKYECKLRTKTGGRSVSEEAFEDYDIPFVKRWVDWNKLKRLRTTDLIGTLHQTDSAGFLHPFFHLHFATTYRSSSSDPNFQNKPNRDPRLAKLIRRAFIPRSDEFVLIEADYGALEFRGAACFWKDPGMIAFASDNRLDIHRDMGAECYLLATNQVSKLIRGMAKNKYVFPTLYGSWHKNTGRDLWSVAVKGGMVTTDGVDLLAHLASKGIRTEEAFIQHIKKVEEKFSTRFSHWAEAKDVWWADYLRNGEFPLMTGFVCRGVYSYNNLMNTPIQGPSFHLLLWSLIELNKWLRKNKMRSKVIGQIHDSIAVDAHRAELQDVLERIELIMTRLVKEHWDWVVTPLEVEVDVAETNWFEKRPWVKNSAGVWASKA